MTLHAETVKESKQYIPSNWKQITKSECYPKLDWIEENKHWLWDGKII